MHVLVVGASGFVGRLLTQRLLDAGHSVEAWDRLPVEAQPGLEAYAVDLLGDAPLPEPTPQPWDAAFHLAAYSVPGMAWTEEQIMAMGLHELVHQLRYPGPSSRAEVPNGTTGRVHLQHAHVGLDGIPPIEEVAHIVPAAQANGGFAGADPFQQIGNQQTLGHAGTHQVEGAEEEDAE